MSVNGGLWQTEATKRCDMQIAQRLCQHAFKSTRVDKTGLSGSLRIQRGFLGGPMSANGG